MKSRINVYINEISKLSGIIDIVNYNESYYFNTIGDILPGGSNILVFVSKTNKDKYKLINTTSSEIIICDQNVDESKLILKNKCLIKVDDPKLFFSIIGNKYFIQMPIPSIHPTAVIDKEAIVHPTVYIGPNCTIGKVKIDANTVIYGNVNIYDNTIIGKNVKINAGSVIGAEGFGYNRNKDGVAVQFPHIGGVIIEDNVDIGSNTSIDRGALSDTIIKKGAKIDNLVHIAHNVQIGEDAYIIANSMIAGSVIIGKRAYVAPSASIKDQLNISDYALVGMGGVVLKNIETAQVWTGNPAREIKELIKLNKALKILLNSTEG